MVYRQHNVQLLSVVSQMTTSLPSWAVFLMRSHCQQEKTLDLEVCFDRQCCLTGWHLNTSEDSTAFMTQSTAAAAENSIHHQTWRRLLRRFDLDNLIVTAARLVTNSSLLGACKVTVLIVPKGGVLCHCRVLG